jgi:hypothetical protein
VGDEAFFEADFFALEIGQGFNAWSGDDHVIAVGEVIEEEGDGGFAGGAGDESVAVGHADGVDLAGDVGVHGGDVVEPLEVDFDAFFFEPAFLDADFPGDPAGPVGVTNFERLSPARPAGQTEHCHHHQRKETIWIHEDD